MSKSKNGRGRRCNDDADAIAFCTATASTRSKLLAAKEATLPFPREVVVIVVATVCCTLVATTITEFKPELKQLTLNIKTIFTWKKFF